ncbi:carbon-nitrogen hydrolase family protein [Francisellaceae bacterium]|nr:carbon-nitrogen hydrolase family protein [Francisellaceae bacterium]
MSKVAVIQMNSCAAIGPNLIAAKRLLKEAAAGGAKLAVLPENFGFFASKPDEYLVNQEVLDDGRIQNFIKEIARSEKMWIIAGTIPLVCPENTDRVYTASILFDDKGRLVTAYNKIHLFDVTVSENETYKESDSFYPGNEIKVVDTPIGRIGLSICYDLRFPELFRKMREQGAEIFTLPAAFTSTTGVVHWRPLIKARAIENQCYVLAANQSGYHQDNGNMTHGHSMIVDPWGEVQALQIIGEGNAMAEIDLDNLYKVRQKIPCFEHRKLKTDYKIDTQNK